MNMHKKLNNSWKEVLIRISRFLDFSILLITDRFPKYENFKSIIFQMTEKIVLPTAEDVKAEKTHQGLIQGVESFTPDKLKPAKTREPASGSDGIIFINVDEINTVILFYFYFIVMKTEMAHNASLEGVKQFDQNNLKQVETQEKNPLPDPEGIFN